jgi:hypothetical protein
MGSPRYIAEHLLLPRFVREKGASAVLEAIERGDADFFIPVWMEAGFRFNTRLMYRTQGGMRLGMLTLPMPREVTEAYFALVVGKAADPAYLRYFLWETSDPGSDDEPRTVISEWAGAVHRNYGSGPPFTRDLANDSAKFVARVAELCGGGQDAAQDTDSKG